VELNTCVFPFIARFGIVEDLYGAYRVELIKGEVLGVVINKKCVELTLEGNRKISIPLSAYATPELCPDISQFLDKIESIDVAYSELRIKIGKKRREK